VFQIFKEPELFYEYFHMTQQEVLSHRSGRSVIAELINRRSLTEKKNIREAAVII